MKGEVLWAVGGHELLVDQRSFLVLQEGQKYSLEIDSHEAVETCCVFFQSGFVEGVAQDTTSPLRNSLDFPERPAPPLRFLSRLHTNSSDGLLSNIWDFAEKCSEGLQPSSFEESFLTLSRRLLALYEEVQLQVSRVPAAKTSTKNELFRRLERAREYMHSHSTEPVSLNVVARESCLSPYHLHRSFTQVFCMTPHSYLTGLRLDKANALLEAGWSVSDVCMEVGFSSPASFSRLFRSHFGISPSSVSKIRKIR